MNYIIVWRATHRDPFVDKTTRGFMEEFPDYETAKEFAEKIMADENEGGKSPHYFDYKIYQESRP